MELCPEDHLSFPGNHFQGIPQFPFPALPFPAFLKWLPGCSSAPQSYFSFKFRFKIQFISPLCSKKRIPLGSRSLILGFFFAQKAEFLDILTYLELLALARWHVLGKQCCGVSFILIFKFFFLQPKKKLRKQDLEMEEQGKSIPGTGDLGKKNPKKSIPAPRCG